MKRVAVIYDDQPRPETTGLYCRRALGALAQSGRIQSVEHVLPSELVRVQQGQFDLFLYVDDGRQRSVRKDLRPAIWWGIDSHLDFNRCLEMAVQCDFTFAAQRDGVEQLHKEGIKHAQWLPLACDPDFHGRRDEPNRYDISFVGNVSPGIRSDLLSQIQSNYERSYIGNAYFDEMAKIYSASTIVFNRSILNDINMRVFEGLCSGALLLTNDLSENGLSKLLNEGEHYVSYRDEEALSCIDELLRNPEKCQEIGNAGREVVLERHTYLHRVLAILDYLESSQRTVRTDKRFQHQKQNSKEIYSRRKSTDYFEFERPDVLRLIPSSAKRILDIGCGGGRLGAAIKQRQSAYVSGIELNADAAERAAHVLDEVIIGNVLLDDLQIPSNSFDCIVCADVLEHIDFPEAVLERIYGWLAADGCLVTSIPNVRNHSVVGNLLAGNWTYESQGLLDDDHVRFFTKSGVQRTLFRQGFSIVDENVIYDHQHEKWKSQSNRRLVDTEYLKLELPSDAFAEEFFAYQYLNVSKKIVRPSESLTTIVIVTYNQLDYTRECLDSVISRTTFPFELIIVDNGSSDGTVEFLRTLENVQLIENHKNRGFPAAVNQGVDAARGDAIALLNNDTIVTTGWLERLRNVLDSNETIGAVGPLTNRTAGPQRIPAKYTLKNLDDFAWRLRLQNCGQRISTPDVTGFCMLVDRKVFNEVGKLDESFDLGLYEDVDFCTRIVQSGFDISIACDSFVHHFGHKSFQAAEVDEERLAVENENKLYHKWGLKNYIVRSEDQLQGGGEWNYESPISLHWDDGLNPARQLLASFSDRCHSTLVVVADENDLALAETVRERYGCQVVICTERDQHIDDFQFSTMDELLEQQLQFDAIICREFNRHRNSTGLLNQMHRLLREDGELYFSVPNARSAARVNALITGTWEVDTWDPSLKFFTRRELEKLLYAGNFTPVSWNSIFSSKHGEWIAQGRPLRLTSEEFSFRVDDSLEVEDVLTDEFVIRAKRNDRFDKGLTSIVIVTFNQITYTRACLQSLRLRTTVPYEVIFVDNGSTDGTVDYLRSLDDVHLIENETNYGFPKAANQGFREANGANVVFLNNDTILTTGWLRNLLEQLYKNEDVGLVGPVSNNVSGPQQVHIRYSGVASLDGAAWAWTQAHRGQYRESDRLVGFCILGRKSLFDEIGVFDERFGIGNFEDDDLTLRVRQKGLKTVIVDDSFVHHFGGVTFQASHVDYGRLLEENHAKFVDKWDSNQSKTLERNVQENRESDVHRGPRPTFLLDVNEHDALLLSENNVHLSAALIVRDNEETIHPCLESLIPWVDEVVIVDTGSLDRTPEICREFGARVFHHPWEDSFSTARNQSLGYCRGRWIFWMDSDDTLPAECGAQLRQIAEGPHDDGVFGYVMQVHCPGTIEADVTVVDHVKLFRNDPRLRFEFRIHEQIIPSIRRLGGEVKRTDVHVIHSGSDQTSSGRERKRERDFRLLNLEMRDNPDHPFVLFNLGMTCSDAGNFKSAVAYLERCLAVSHAEESHVRKAYALLVHSYSEIGQPDLANECCMRGVSHFPEDPELQFRQAILAQSSGDLSQARDIYLNLLNIRDTGHFRSVDAGITSHKAKHNLAVVLDQQGEFAEAQKHWLELLQNYPHFEPAWRCYGEALLKSGNRAAFDLFLERMKSSGFSNVKLLLQAHLAEECGQLVEAVMYLKKANKEAPADSTILNELSRLHCKNDDWQEAVESLIVLTRLEKNDAAAWHNLACAQLQIGQKSKAANSIERSLIIRPGAQHSLDLQAQILGGSHNVSVG